VNFRDLQQSVMSRLNYSSADARDLVKEWLNQRYREVTSSTNLSRTRRGVATMTTVVGNRLVSASGIAKVMGVVDPLILRRPLLEVTVEQIRAFDAAEQVVGAPTHYAILRHQNDTVTLTLFPTPTSVSNLAVDALLAGTDMVVDSDEPSFPVDFHDVLIHGAMADALTKLEKEKLALKAEMKFEKRAAELRYFLMKSAYLSRTQRDGGDRTAPRGYMV
jgi:hypothetical protein